MLFYLCNFTIQEGRKLYSSGFLTNFLATFTNTFPPLLSETIHGGRIEGEGEGTEGRRKGGGKEGEEDWREER